MTERPTLAALMTLLVLGCGPASAHVGEASGSGLVTGFLHPLMGADHVAAMFAVGLWGAFLGRPAVIFLPVAFPLMMAAGAALGIAGVPLAGIETGIAASALVIGLCVAAAARLPLAAAVAIVAVFAIFHGYAHGQEMPGAASPLAYAIGFVTGTGLLHLAGIGFGLLTSSSAGRIAVRVAGGVIAASGLGFLTGAL